MVKKILSSIIIIMMIFSFTFAYATELPEGSLGEVQQPEDTNKEETTTPESENQNTDNNTGDSSGSTTKPEEDNNTNVNPGDNSGNDNTNPDSSGSTDSIPDNDNNINNDTGKEDNNTGNNNQGSNNQDNNQGNNNGNVNNNTQQEQQKPTQNNQGSLNNNYVQPKSSEARLKELKVDVEGLTPAFDKNTTEYYLVVDLSVNKINVKASTVDNKAKWAIYGNKNLKEGENIITIIVTAEDGTKKEYYIHVTKVDDVELANAELDYLEIDGYNIYPSFKSNIYSYNLNISEEINSLDIKAIPQNENATVKIEGNKNLQEGENIIKINVTAENAETVRTYKINTYISLDKVEIEEESKVPALVLIIVLGTVIVVLGIYIVLKSRR